MQIAVAATGLNFRDVLRALGLLPRRVRTALGHHLRRRSTFGFECTGTVSAVGEGVTHLAVGDEVLAIALGSLASHVMAPAGFVVRKPALVGAEEAATLPLAFLTACYGLERLAQLRPGERVLIHAAAGGVGQAAVQLARRLAPKSWPRPARQVGIPEGPGVGARVQLPHGGICGAGPRCARAGVEWSGAQQPERGIHPRQPEGLRRQRRFVEIGKLGIWTAEQMAAERPDVKYLAFDLGEEERREPGLTEDLLGELQSRLERGELAPLPCQVFPVEQAVEAFRQMARAGTGAKW